MSIPKPPPPAHLIAQGFVGGVEQHQGLQHVAAVVQGPLTCGEDGCHPAQRQEDPSKTPPRLRKPPRGHPEAVLGWRGRLEKFPVWGQGRILLVSPADEGQAAGGSRFPRPFLPRGGEEKGGGKGRKSAGAPPPSPRGGSGDAVATEEAASQGFSTWESRGWSPGGTKRRRLARSRHKKGFKKAARGSRGTPKIRQDPTNGACQGLGGGFTPLWVCPPPPNFFFYL